MKDPAYLSSPTHHPVLPPKLTLPTQSDDQVIPILSQSQFTFKALLTLTIQPNCMTEIRILYTSVTSKSIPPYQYWLNNGVKVFSPQSNFLRSSIFDLKTGENDPSFLLVAQKAAHHTQKSWNAKNLRTTLSQVTSVLHQSQ